MREVYKQLQSHCSYARVSLALCAVFAADTSEHQEGNRLLPDHLHSGGFGAAGTLHQACRPELCLLQGCTKPRA